jgi:hypothetical protein
MHQTSNFFLAGKNGPLERCDVRVGPLGYHSFPSQAQQNSSEQNSVVTAAEILFPAVSAKDSRGNVVVCKVNSQID